MAQRLAAERSHKCGAITVVGALLSESLARRFTPSRSMPILLCTGQPILSHPMKEAGRQPGGARVLSVEDTVKIWVHFNGCKKSPEVQDIHGLNNGTLVSVFTYGSCKNNSQVKLYKIEDGGHVWPGEPGDLSKSGVGKLSRKIDASEEIWEFFKRISKAEKEKRDR